MRAKYVLIDIAMFNKWFFIPARYVFVALWAGVVFLCGVAYAQEKNIDTLHIIHDKVDTVWLGFEDVLHLSALYDSADREDWHYIYRWNTGERTESVHVKFEGKRKALYTGQRFSAIHWPEEYDTFHPSDAIVFLNVADPEEDTVILCVPYVEGGNTQYLWATDSKFKNTLPDTGRCAIVYRGSEQEVSYCKATTSLGENEPAVRVFVFSHRFLTKTSGGVLQTPGESRHHDYNVWSLPEGTQIYAHLYDTLHFFSELNPTRYPEHAGREIIDYGWQVEPFTYVTDTSVSVCFEDHLFRRFTRNVSTCQYSPPISFSINHYVYFGIKPDAEIETDSVWVFFPQYPHSNLGGRVDICLRPGEPLPSPEDTLQTFNLGPWNRELDYVAYAWFDGSKTASGEDSIVGTDSAFAYTFAMMDSVGPDLYAGLLATRVAADSLWQDSCGCFVPCTEAACHRYDTVRIYLHTPPRYLPQDTLLCAHRDLDLRLPEEADTLYRCFWLDADSVEMPYGHDTTRFTVQGMRGLDGFGAGTDTRTPRLFQLRLDHRYCGLSYFDTIRVYDAVRPALTLPFHDTVICLDVPVELDTLSPHVCRDLYAFAWNTGDTVPAYTFTDSGTYVLGFFLRENAASCGYDTASDTVHVLWSDPAMTRITLPADTGFCPKLSVTLDARVPFGSTRYEWRSGAIPEEEDYYGELDSVISTLPARTFKEEGTFNISLIDTLNCRNVMEINIAEEDCTPKIEIPNVFTPNGDGVNDVWRFKTLESCRDVVIEVVDRWGQPVLRKEVPAADDFEWNGTMHGKGKLLPDGPYFYMVSYRDAYGKRRVQSGSVTILGTGE